MDADKNIPSKSPLISPQGPRRVQLSKLLGNNDSTRPTPEKNLWPGTSTSKARVGASLLAFQSCHSSLTPLHSGVRGMPGNWNFNPAGQETSGGYQWRPRGAWIPHQQCSSKAAFSSPWEQCQRMLSEEPGLSSLPSSYQATPCMGSWNS